MLYTEKQLKIAKLNDILRLLDKFEGRKSKISQEDFAEIHDFLVKAFEDVSADLVEILRHSTEENDD